MVFSFAPTRFAVSTHDQYVFNFYRDGRACNGVSEALQRYREIAPHVRLSGIMHMHLIQSFRFCSSLPLMDVGFWFRADISSSDHRNGNKNC